MFSLKLALNPRNQLFNTLIIIGIGTVEPFDVVLVVLVVVPQQDVAGEVLRLVVGVPARSY